MSDSPSAQLLSEIAMAAARSPARARSPTPPGVAAALDAASSPHGRSPAARAYAHHRRSLGSPLGHHESEYLEDFDVTSDSPPPRRRLTNQMRDEHGQTAPKGQLPKKIKMPVEQPKGPKEVWWTISGREWAGLNKRRQATKSHVGHIMDDRYGCAPYMACTHCEKNYSGSCRVYRPEVVK